MKSSGSIWHTTLCGLISGTAGVAVMTLGEKLEQALTGRPNSFVPAHTLERLLRLPHKPDSERVALNWTMHYGQGAVAGVIRAFMARGGLGGAPAVFMFTGARFSIDQTLENATGVGAPPWTWPRNELYIDLLHKAVYAFATGALVDRWVAPRNQRRS